MHEPNKLDLFSMDVAAEKCRQLKQIVPEVFTETKNDEGEVVEAVDFVRLKTTLGEFSEILERKHERYGLVWPGKNECQKLIQRQSVGTLKPDRAESVNFDETENIFIEGDNLEVLKLLQKSYYGKVKMIYIDPPYNTGKDFIYNDDYSEPLEAYLRYIGQIDSSGRRRSTNSKDSGRFHSKWLSMMYPRLHLAWNLLREDGVLFISIDDGELSNLRNMCDEIFGEENRLDRGLMIWPNKGSTKGFRKIVKNHEYILAYGRNAEIIESCFFKNFEINDPLEERLQIKRTSRNPPAKVRFPKGLRIKTKESLHLSGPISPGTNQIDIHEGNLRFVNGKLMEDVILEASFPYKDQMEEFFSKLGTNEPTYDTKGQRWLEIYFTKKGVPYYRKERNVKVISSILENVPNSGLNDLVSLGDDLSIDNPKPVDLICELLSYFTSDGDLVMDFFSGSSTTAAAALKLNTKAKGERKFIMVQLPEIIEKKEVVRGDYKTIADIGKERIRRVIKKILAE